MIVSRIHTRLSLARDLDSLGIRAGDMVMVHAAMKRVGRLLSGPDVLIEALRDAVGPAGTIVAYTDWNGAYDALLDENGRVPPEWRAHIAPFDPAVSRAARDNGVLAEFIRTTPGARRSMLEEFDTSEPVVPGLDDDYFGVIVRAFLASGQGAQGLVGDAQSVLVDAAAICSFAVAWLEHHVRLEG
ncbi:AAC(3) family N-acetyltransferase [Rhizobium leguminosarum]|uniref:AAC(3) family N-acetyltransferase n=1 Tax=Rhizobium leguminosarum TaxID=384 RepID=UPI001C98234D|nr:AAC(3) family N-acetyltransferase [Rhizobium leguminosarum]MBY5608392.1 AAC(3) family N-acetyltransferase [Rhizobium leguminosarum]MBY5656630.1 AAC(3) family N-acetyltransferase [Rhizobium leguminosarum]